MSLACLHTDHRLPQLLRPPLHLDRVLYAPAAQALALTGFLFFRQFVPRLKLVFRAVSHTLLECPLIAVYAVRQVHRLHAEHSFLTHPFRVLFDTQLTRLADVCPTANTENILHILVRCRRVQAAQVVKHLFAPENVARIPLLLIEAAAGLVYVDAVTHPSVFVVPFPLRLPHAVLAPLGCAARL